MIVTLLRTPSTAYKCTLTEGQTGDVDDVIAEKLIADGIAVAGGTIKAVPPEAEIAETETRAETEHRPLPTKTSKRKKESEDGE